MNVNGLETPETYDKNDECDYPFGGTGTEMKPRGNSVHINSDATCCTQNKFTVIQRNKGVVSGIV